MYGKVFIHTWRPFSLRVVKTRKDESEVGASRMERFPGSRKVKSIKGPSVVRKFLIDSEKQVEALGLYTYSGQEENC